MAYPHNIMNIGSVRVTREHDYRHFLYIVFLTVATLVVIGWAYYEGLVTKTIDAIGTPFAAGFTILLTAGLFNALQEAYRLSGNINRLKAEHLSGDNLRRLFGIEAGVVPDVSLLKEEIADIIFLQIDNVRYVANLAVTLGLAGTVWGMVLALEELGGVKDVSKLIERIPTISDQLSIAFYTTLVGIVVHAVLSLAYRMLRSASVDLKTRIFRSLHEQLQVR